jgi:hypothetical protein
MLSSMGLRIKPHDTLKTHPLQPIICKAFLTDEKSSHYRLAFPGAGAHGHELALTRPIEGWETCNGFKFKEFIKASLGGAYTCYKEL